MLEGVAGEEVLVLGVVVDREEDEDSEEEPAEAGEVVRGGPRRHGRRRRPGGGGGSPRVRVAAGEAAAGPCTHLTLTTLTSYMWQAGTKQSKQQKRRNMEVPGVRGGRHTHTKHYHRTGHSR